MDQFNIIAVVVAQNLHGGVALLGQILAAPLGESGAGDGSAVAELGGQRLYKALAADVVVENFVYHLADILEDVAATDKLLIVGGGRGDGKGIALCTIPFCVYTIQGKGLNDEDVGRMKKLLRLKWND